MAVPVEVKVKMDSPLSVCDAVSGVRALYQKAELCDLEFHVDGHIFPVHQGILACGSTKFRSFLKHVVHQSGDGNEDNSALKGMISVVQPPAAARPAGEAPATEPAKEEEPAAAGAAAAAAAVGTDSTAPASEPTPPPAADAAGAEPAPPSDAQAAASTSEPPAPAGPVAAPSTDTMDVSAPPSQQDAAPTEAAQAPAVTEPVDTPAASAESQRLRLKVAGITHPEAFTIMLNYVYEVGAGLPWSYEPSSKEVNKDVLRLAKEFGLNHLHDHAARWLTRSLTTSNVVERLVTMEDFGLGPLREKVIEQLAWKPEELGMVSTSPEIMQHPRILQDILVKVASQRGKAQKKEVPPVPVEEKPDAAALEAEARAKEAAEKEAAEKAAAEKAAVAKAAEARAAAAEAEAKAAAAKAAAAAAEAERLSTQRAAEERAAAERAAAERAAAERAAAEKAAAEKAAAEEVERLAREAEATRRTVPLAERLEASSRAGLGEKAGKQEKPTKQSAKGAAKAPPAKRQKKG